MDKYKDTFSKIKPEEGAKERIIHNMETKRERKIAFPELFRFHKKLAFACIAILLFFASLPVPQVRAAIRQVGEFFYESIGDCFGRGGLTEINQYSNAVLMTVEDQEIKICLNEAVIDENNLIATFTFQYEKEVDGWGISAMGGASINGKDLKDDGYGMSAEKTAKNQYQGYLKKNIDGVYKGGKADCEIVLSDLFINKEQIMGEWKFNFTINDNKLVSETLTAKPNKTIELTNGDPFKIKEMKKNATGTAIYAEVKVHEELTAYFIAGTDQNGKEIYFPPVQTDLMEKDWTFTLFDIENVTRTNLDQDVREVNVAVYSLPPNVGAKGLKDAKEGNRISEFVNIKLR